MVPLDSLLLLLSANFERFHLGSPDPGVGFAGSSLRLGESAGAGKPAHFLPFALGIFQLDLSGFDFRMNQLELEYNEPGVECKEDIPLFNFAPGIDENLLDETFRATGKLGVSFRYHRPREFPGS